ncbi:MAG TPA: phosphoribosyl-AMP cyclohydrolase, partial [Nitrospirae bacterium]|nr:phosphoribosyl-AMP cyclohydrolase [Nitrospirota bacterium]
SDEVLMLAYMNKTSLERTIKTGKTHFWSRSRQGYWLKGETSGNFQLVREIRYDCDRDALLVKVEQLGAGACHTGNSSCFYRVIDIEENE